MVGQEGVAMAFIGLMLGIGGLVYMAVEEPEVFVFWIVVALSLPPVRYVALAIWDVFPSLHPVFKTGIEGLLLIIVPVVVVGAILAALKIAERRHESWKYSEALLGATVSVIVAAYLTFGYVYVPPSTYERELWWMDTIWATTIIALYAGTSGFLACLVRREL